MHSYFAHIAVQLFYRAQTVLQGSHLPDHVHALIQLLLQRHFDQFTVDSVLPLGGNSQSAHSHGFQLGPSRLGVHPRLRQTFFFTVEQINKTGRQTANGMPGRGFNQGSFLTYQGLALKLFQNRAILHSLGRGDVGRAHQHTHLGTTGGKWRSQYRHHRSRHFVVNATGKQHMQSRQIVLFQHAADRLLPQHEAVTRANMPTTFTAFEHKMACTFLEEQVKQARRRHMEVSRNTAFRERLSLRRPPPGTQHCRWFEFFQQSQLWLKNGRVCKTQHTDPPRQVAHLVGSFFKQLATA